MSPQGTRSTLLDARPQDYSSSGYIDWPFMSTHSWGENPRGRWVLEIHNDAYSKWASDAKFFKWSLELYGVRYDPNSDEYRSAHGSGPNVVREAPAMPPMMMHTEATTTTRTTTITSSTTTTTTTTTTTEYIPRGCVSKRSECTQSVEKCRTFTHRSVAQVFCRCSSICLEIASISDESFNMQCNASGEKKPKTNMVSSTSLADLSSARSLKEGPVTDIPFYCQFIPFFSYN
jgi:subtilisin-like proprotein convertase family protein